MSESPGPNVFGDSARFMSDGLTLLLEEGIPVRPRVRAPDADRPWVATWVDPEAGEVGLGPEADDTRVVLYLSPAAAVFNQDGERVFHYEWNGALWCDHEDEAFEAEEYWETGEIVCPHCGDDVTSSRHSEGASEGGADA